MDQRWKKDSEFCKSENHSGWRSGIILSLPMAFTWSLFREFPTVVNRGF